MPKLDPTDLVMIEPLEKFPAVRFAQPPAKRMFWWTTRAGGREKVNEIRVKARAKTLGMKCTVQDLMDRLSNCNSLVVNKRTGEVFNGDTIAR